MPPKPGDRIELLLEAVEDEDGSVVLSYRKARRQKEWVAFAAGHKEGDVVSGPVTRKSESPRGAHAPLSRALRYTSI